jgi:hypothetical protein
VYARLEVQADRGYRQIHSDDVEELLAEIERLRAVEAAARLALGAEREWRESGGTSAELANAMCDAQAALRVVIGGM